MKKSAPKKQKTTRSAAEAAVKTLIEWIGEDPAREGLLETPARVVRAFDEYFSGYNSAPEAILAKTFSETGNYDEPVLVRGIEFESRCEHHMAPFIGTAHVAYIPNGRIVGLSKIARLVDAFARRMQTQERLTSQVADALYKHLNAKGVAVKIEAEHFCMKVRGVRKDHAVTVTTRFLGQFKKNPDLRREFLDGLSE